MSTLSLLVTALLDHPSDDELRARLRAELLVAGGWDWPTILGFVLDCPAHDGPRMLAADWLDDDDQADRAAFVRAQCRLLQMLDVYGADVMADLAAVRLSAAVGRVAPGLMPELAEDLLPPWARLTCEPGDGTLVTVGGGGVALDYVRGFVGRAEMPTNDFLDGAGELFAREPVVVVRLTDKEPVEVCGGWWWADSCLAPSDPLARAGYIPPDLYDELLRPRRDQRAGVALAAELTFATRDKALAALSTACVRYGRAAAGLRWVG